MSKDPEIIEGPSIPISTNQGLFLTSIVGACMWFGASTITVPNQGTEAICALLTFVPILAIIFRLLGDSES